MKGRPLSRREALRYGSSLAAAGVISAGCSSFHGFSTASRRNVKIYDIRDYGAVGDGKTPDSAAIQRAIDDASAAAATGTDAQVLLRGGKKYLVGSIQLKAGIEFHLADNAVLLASTNPQDYGVRGATSGPATAPGARSGRGGRGGGVGGGNVGVFTATQAHGLRITGTGTIDGQSPEFMDHYEAENEWWRPKLFRPRLLNVVGCKDFEIRDVTLRHGAGWTLHLLGCTHALVDRIKIQNQLDVPNCDGIDPDQCQDVEIRNSHIICGDDAIVIKSGRGGGGTQYGPSSNIHVKDCILETQDSGLKIGTETGQDIFNIVFERCEIRQGCRGLCIQLRDAGSVYNVEFRDIKFTSRYFSAPWWGRGEAISFTSFPRTEQTKVGTIHDICVKNVTGLAENSVRIEGSPEARTRDVTLENVAITMDRWTKYAGGVFDNRPPETAEKIEPHGNPGYHIRNADNVTLRNCSVAWGKNRPDYFTHAVEGTNVTNLKLENFKGEAAHPERYKAISINETPASKPV